jgi:hypothetical protein
MRIAYILLVFLLHNAGRAAAQVDLGPGAQLDFPMMFNKNVGSYHHSLGAVGVRVNTKFYLRNNTFYPSLTLHATGIKVPVVKLGNTVVNMLFAQVNVTAGANIRKVFDNHRELHYGLGIGISYLDAYAFELNETAAAKAMSYSVDAASHITRIIPAVTPQVEYIFPISQEKPLYVGIGGQIQYTYFYDDGSKYTVQVLDAAGQYQKLDAALLGSMINPGAQLSVYYRFGKNRSDY